MAEATPMRRSWLLLWQVRMPEPGAPVKGRFADGHWKMKQTYFLAMFLCHGSQGSHEDDFYHKLVERICGKRMQKDPSNILQTKLLLETLCCKSAEFSSLKLIVIKDSACLSISRGCLFEAKTSELGQTSSLRTLDLKPIFLGPFSGTPNLTSQIAPLAPMPAVSGLGGHRTTTGGLCGIQQTFSSETCDGNV